MDGQPRLVPRWHRLCRECLQGQGQGDVLRRRESAGPDKLFNNGLDGNKWRSIDFGKGDMVNETSLAALVRSAVNHNHAKVKTGTKTKTKTGTETETETKTTVRRTPSAARKKTAK